MVDETAMYEQEAEATRDRIAATMEHLQTRLSPRTIINNAVDEISVRSSNVVDTIKDVAAAHPLVLAATGLLVGVSLLARSRIKTAVIEYGDSYAAYADFDDGYAANLLDNDGGRHGVGDRVGALNDRARDAVDDNPLAVIVVGIATGALLGGIVPISDVENRILGHAHDRLAAAGRAAADAAHDQLDITKFSLRGGVAGLTDQAANAIGSIADAARRELVRPAA